MKMYVIHKKTRLPGTQSYCGPTWDRAGLRPLLCERYDNKATAIWLAGQLSIYNPVGFEVSEIEVD